MKKVFEFAREAGNDDLFDAMQVAFLEKLVDLVRAEEREACAMVCMLEIGGMGDGYDCATSIRARGQS